MGTKIIGTGSALPGLTIHNTKLEEIMDTSDEWIRSRTGIEERHIAVEETTTSLAVTAARKAMENAGVSGEEIDLIIDLCNGKDIPTDKRLALLKAIHHIKDTQIERSILESINGSDSRISKFLDEAEHLNKAVPDSN